MGALKRAGREPAEVGLCVCGGGGGGPVRADPPRSDCCEAFEVERCMEEVEPLAPLDRFGELFATGPFDSLLNDGGGGGGGADNGPGGGPRAGDVAGARDPANASPPMEPWIWGPITAACLLPGRPPQAFASLMHFRGLSALARA